MKNSGIQWTTHSFNPWIGCQRVSPGCEHCYAEAQDNRWRPGNTRWGPKAPRTRTSPSYWRQPIAWNRDAAGLKERPRVFCASLADVFEDRAELLGWRQDLFGLIAATPRLDWLLLTKRPENIQELWPGGAPPSVFNWPNVWLGTTVEDQQRANERIPHLAAVPAVVRFLSCEPLLEQIDLSQWFDEDKLGFVNSPIDWVIIGGESGAKARPFHTEWARSLIGQCRDGGRSVEPVPFVKQLGENPVGAGRDQLALLAMKDRHGGEPAEWPEDLRVREFPITRAG